MKYADPLKKISSQAQSYWDRDEMCPAVCQALHKALQCHTAELGQCFVNVKQSVWRGKAQTPKTANSIRQFAISPQLASHLRAYLSTPAFSEWR